MLDANHTALMCHSVGRISIAIVTQAHGEKCEGNGFGYVCMSVCMSVYICMFVCLSMRLTLNSIAPIDLMFLDKKY